MRNRTARLAWLVLVLVLVPDARAQVAFSPTVQSFNNGVNLNVAPVVTADRRYVRLTLNPQFNALSGFDSYSVPAAVGGGGGNLGGLLGGGGNRAGGGGGGGFRMVPPRAPDLSVAKGPAIRPGPPPAVKVAPRDGKAPAARRAAR